MSGHSKWHRIKHKKEATDARRGQQFTRLVNQIKQAATAGTDPQKNPILAEAISRAKAANMPQANIERLLTGDKNAKQEEVTYEAFGPYGTSLLIITRTDNRRRTVAELRTILTKHQGTLGEPGSVQWKFNPLLCITINAPATLSLDQLELDLIDSGVEDVHQAARKLRVYFTADRRSHILTTLKKHRLRPQSSKPIHRAQQIISLKPNARAAFNNLLVELENHPNITRVYTDTD